MTSEQLLRAATMLPCSTASCHAHSAIDWVLPRRRLNVGGFFLPGSFLKMTSLSVDSRKSTGSTSVVIPCSSENEAISYPSMVIEKRAAVRASWGCSAPSPMAIDGPYLLFEPGAVGELGQTEDDEFGWLDWGDTDLNHQHAGVAVLGRVVLGVALDKKRLGGRLAEERAVAPDPAQEHGDRALHRVPELRVVGLEDHPVGAVEDRLLDVVEEPAHVEVTPLRVAGECARAPDPDALAGERPDAVDAVRVELVVLALGQVQLQRDRAAYDLVGGRLVHAAGGVVAGPDAGHVPTRRDERRCAAQRVHHLDPRPVERGVLGVVVRLGAPALHLLRVKPGRRVQDRDPVPHELAVRDHRVLNGPDALVVEQATVPGG